MDGNPAKKQRTFHGGSNNNRGGSGGNSNNHGNNNSTGNHRHQSDDLYRHRCNLPIYPARSRLIGEIRKATSAIVIGETGSGKTTQIPQVEIIKTHT